MPLVLTDLLTLSLPLPDEGYSRSMLYILNLISMFLLLIHINMNPWKP
jgi:hypothetical protein